MQAVFLQIRPARMQVRRLDNVIVENTPYTLIIDVKSNRHTKGSKTVRKSMIIIDSLGLSIAVKKALVTILNHVNR